MEQYQIRGKTGTWEIVIGLEVHCQIISKAKLFSAASTTFGSEPNSQVAFLDAGLPGILPRLNMFCVEQAVKTGLALHGNINLKSYFDRKSYFYPDLPLGYQITQFFTPIMEKGYLDIELSNGNTKRIGINRLHIEQDAGKLLHEYHATKSLIDLNRAGVGLMEIVSEPELRSPAEVASYLNQLRSIVRYLGTCDGNMEEGSMRCDINISVRKLRESFRNRVEVKNVNSIKFIVQAIEFEVKRQVEIWENNDEVQLETRLFDSLQGITISLRTKEDAGDYRYFRDPDLLALVLTKDYVENINEQLPELPNLKKQRLIKEYALNKDDVDILVSDKAYAEYFEEAIAGEEKKIINPKLVVSWILTNLFAVLNKESLSIKQSKILPKQLGQLVKLIEDNMISGKIAKDVFELMWKNSGVSPVSIIEEKGWKQISDTSKLESIITKILESNYDKVSEIKLGKEKLLGWFVGQVMKESAGQANPEMVNTILREKIFNTK